MAKAHYIGPLPLELYSQIIAHLASIGFGRPDSAAPGGLGFPASLPVVEAAGPVAG